MKLQIQECTMAKAPHKWSVTATRKGIIIKMLEKQHTIGTLATSFGVTEKTMSKALKAAKIDPKQYRRKGISDIKSRMFERLETVDKDKDYVELALKIVDKYDTEEPEADEGSGAKSVDTITAKIMLEMTGGK